MFTELIDLNLDLDDYTFLKMLADQKRVSVEEYASTMLKDQIAELKDLVMAEMSMKQVELGQIVSKDEIFSL